MIRYLIDLYNITGDKNILKLAQQVGKQEKILINLGLSPEMAGIIYRDLGKLTLFLLNKVCEDSKEKSITDFKDRSLYEGYRDDFITIRDYLRVSNISSENFKKIKKMSFDEIVTIAEDWHESLTQGEGSINYIEKGDILIDFRDSDGTGFYWVDLNTNNSIEESERMGHCGSAGHRETIISLRSYSKIPGYPNLTINKSHLTGAIYDLGNESATLTQLKGPNNSLPKKEYEPYILKLYTATYPNEIPLFSKYESSYKPMTDFTIADFSEESLKDILLTKGITSENINSSSLISNLNVGKKKSLSEKIKNIAPEINLSNIFGYYTEVIDENTLTRLLRIGRDMSAQSLLEILNGLFVSHNHEYISKENTLEILKRLSNEFKSLIEHKTAIKIDDLDINKTLSNEEEFLIETSYIISELEQDKQIDSIRKDIIRGLNNYGEVSAEYGADAEIKINTADYIDLLDDESDSFDIDIIELISENTLDREKRYINAESHYYHLNNKEIEEAILNNY
jgi:hypothetical protein